MQPFRLLDLPPEIRERIYLLLIQNPKRIALDSHYTNAHDTFPHDLLLVSSQLYHEVRPLYFSSNSFSLTLTTNTFGWDFLLRPSFQDNCREISSLSVTVNRWKTFPELVPVLEDAILNGRLRSLEFGIHEKWAKGKGIPAGNGREYLDAIKRLLGDPYLSTAALKVGDLKSKWEQWELGELKLRNGEVMDENYYVWKIHDFKGMGEEMDEAS